MRVEDLARRFGVTVQTIRRDLTLLTNTGELERVHGGARLPLGTVNTPYAARRAQNHEAKARIAATAAMEVPEGASVFLGIGTTVEAVARALAGHARLLVVTNNLQVAQILAETAEVIVTGGALRAADGGLVGGQTSAAIRQFRFDLGIVGCSALDPEGNILDFDLREVEVSQTVLSHARQVILASDVSKFERKAPGRVASLSEVDLLVTDQAVPSRVAARCAGWGTRVNIASKLSEG